MKRRLSIPALWVRASFWGALVIIILMAASELVLFYIGLGKVSSGQVSAFYEYAGMGGVKYIFRAALCAMFFWLLYSGSSGRMTLGRLAVSETECALWHAGVCLCWLIIMLAAQTGTVLAAFKLFSKTVTPYAVNGQSLVIGFYANRTLHSLLPLSDIRMGIMDVLLYVTAAFSIAVDDHMLRRGGRFPIASGCVVAILEVSVNGDWQKECWYAATACLAVMLIQSIRLHMDARRGRDA